MKKCITLFLVICCVFTLVACKAAPEEEDVHSFEATVLEVHETYLLVEPGEDAWERSSSDKIEVSLQDKTSWPIPQVGDTVNVLYNGELMETYPARVGKVYRVEILTG